MQLIITFVFVAQIIHVISPYFGGISLYFVRTLTKKYSNIKFDYDKDKANIFYKRFRNILKKVSELIKPKIYKSIQYTYLNVLLPMKCCSFLFLVHVY